MKNAACSVVFLMLLVPSISAQFVSPVPVIETEVRDKSSVKLRSIELDRVKREAGKTNTEKLGPARVNNFLEIKEDFEKIQKLQSGIVATYTTGKQINYAKIASFAAEINQSAARLKENLFSPPSKNQKTSPDELPAEEKPEPLESLIVRLDNAIGLFVGNPIFQTKKKVDPVDRKKAESDLVRVFRLSAALKKEAERERPPKN